MYTTQLNTLDNLAIGNQGIILSFCFDCPELTKELLSRYGFTKGSRVILEFKNPWNDLIAVKVHNTLIAIRSTEARFIKIRAFSAVI